MSDKMLLDEMERTLRKIAGSDPNWRLVLGTETLPLEDAILRLRRDKKLWNAVKAHYFGLMIENEQRARQKIEGNSSAPGV